MSADLILDKEIEVNRTVNEAFAYISAFENIREWDPAVRDASRVSTGPLAAGTQFQVDMKAGFSLDYEIVEFDANERVLMQVESRFFRAEEEIQFAPLEPGGCRIRYIAQFYFSLPVKLLAKQYPQLMERVGESAMNGMREALEDQFEAPGASSTTQLADRMILPGLVGFTRLGYRLRKRHWKPVSASMRGRHVVITGATSGIGLAAARAMAAKGATLTLVLRNKSRGRELAKALRAEFDCPPPRIERCDMTVMAQVHGLVKRLAKKGESIDVLVNNAGALFNPRQLTSEGLESSFALLLLAPYVLTEGVKPLLAAADGARVINVTSGGMYSQKIAVGDLQSEGGKYSGATAYARAKRGLMILAEEWARQWRKDDIVVNAMHPGWADTPGVSESLPQFYALTKKVLRSPEEGADTIVWLACASEAAELSGKLWLDREQHPSHVFQRTVESSDEREALLRALAMYAETGLKTRASEAA